MSNLPWFLGPSAIKSYRNPRRYLVLDFETNNHDKGSALNYDNHIVLACWDIVDHDGTITRKHKWADEYDLRELEEDIQDADFIVAHNAKFELQWLKRCGLELRDILVWDTFLAEWVIGGNRYQLSDLGLDETSKRYGLGQKEHLAAMMIGMGIDPEDIPRQWLLPYCYKDVELCRKIYEQQRSFMEEQGLLHLALTRNLCCAVLADIEFNGCQLDAEKVNQEYDQSISRFIEIDEQLKELCGGINLNSSKQLATFLYTTLRFAKPKDRKGKELVTDKGAAKTDVNTLALLRAETTEQEQFLSLYKERNKLAALLSKNLEFFKRIVEERDGTFYGVINQGFTQTHRLSSSGRSILFKALKKAKGVQLQNLPRQYKGLFTAHEEDWLVGEADGAQLEFRVAADLGADEIAAEEIVAGADIHSFTAKVLTDAGEPTTRQQAKASTFAPLYGGGGSTPAQRKYAEFFKKKYKGISSTQENWTYEVLDNGKLRTPYGMIFHWPGTKMRNSGYIDNTTSIYNYPVQGFATAEIIPIALVHFWHRTRDLPIIVWNTIHDSIASRFHKDVEEQYEQLSKISLTTDVYNFLTEVYGYNFKVPLGVGIKVGKHWGTSKIEKVYSVWPDGTETLNIKE